MDPSFAEEPFTGAMDEIRVSGRARSESWIRLSFENQKHGSTVVTIANANEMGAAFYKREKFPKNSH